MAQVKAFWITFLSLHSSTATVFYDHFDLFLRRNRKIPAAKASPLPTRSTTCRPIVSVLCKPPCQYALPDSLLKDTPRFSLTVKKIPLKSYSSAIFLTISSVIHAANSSFSRLCSPLKKTKCPGCIQRIAKTIFRTAGKPPHPLLFPIHIRLPQLRPVVQVPENRQFPVPALLSWHIPPLLLPVLK